MTKEMKERMERMASRTWDQIGGDVLNAVGGTEATMPKDEVMEVVCDADHMMTFGDDKEAYEAWKALPTYKDKLKAIEGAFTYDAYGW